MESIGFFLAPLIAAAIAAAEISSRYREAGARALLTIPGMCYVAISSAIAWLVFALIKDATWLLVTGGAGPNLAVRVAVAVVVGNMLFRSSLFTVRVKFGELTIGPSAIQQMILGMVDREMDRERAQGRAATVAKMMRGVSFDRDHRALIQNCLNRAELLEASQRKAILDEVVALQKSAMNDEVKALNLGLLMTNAFGEEVTKMALDSLQLTAYKPVQFIPAEPSDDERAVVSALLSAGSLSPSELLSRVTADPRMLVDELDDLGVRGLVEVTAKTKELSLMMGWTELMASARGFLKAQGTPTRNHFCWLLPLVFLVSGGCATVDFGYPKVPSQAVTVTADTELGRAVAEASTGKPAGQSGFYLLNDGIEALAARLVLAKRAERSIDVQYYLITNDLIGLIFVGSLLEAADRGVRVRLLLDDILTKGYDAGMAALDSHPNIEVRIFNPFANRGARADALIDFGRVNRRMHNKSFTVDNQVTIIGGRNIASEYFAARQDVNMGDVDVLGIGPVVQDISDMFDLYWNHRAALPPPAFAKMPDDPAEELEIRRERIEHSRRQVLGTQYADAVRESAFELMDTDKSDFVWAPYEVVYDSPDKVDKEKAEVAASIVTPLAEAVRSAREEVIIISPYFVPLDSGEAFLGELRDRDIDVIVITNSLASNNHAIVHSGYAPSRKALLEDGVVLYEVRADAVVAGVGRGGTGAKESVLHTKGFIVDRERLFLGSFNWDPRSVKINTELGVIIDSPELASGTAEFIESRLDEATYEVVLNEDGKLRWLDRQGTEEVLLDKEPQTGFWDRFTVGFYKLLPVKGQL